MARLVVEARTLQSGLSGVGLWVRDVCRGRQGLRVRALWEGRPPCGPMERPGRARVRACSQVVECADAEVSEALLLWIDGCPGIWGRGTTCPVFRGASGLLGGSVTVVSQNGRD